MTEESDWRQAMTIRVSRLEEGLAANSELTAKVHTNTKEMVEFFQSWQGAMKTLDMLGKVAKPVIWFMAAVATASTTIAAWLHVNPPKG